MFHVSEKMSRKNYKNFNKKKRKEKWDSTVAGAQRKLQKIVFQLNSMINSDKAGEALVKKLNYQMLLKHLEAVAKKKSRKEHK